MVTNPAVNAGGSGLIPGPGRFPGEGNSNPLQNPCLENPMDKEPWQARSIGLQTVGHNCACTHTCML